MAFQRVKATIQSMRPPFLVLAPICIFLSASLVRFEHQSQYYALGLIVLAGLLAHISVNTFNEYFDYHSGLDALTHKTPFSGGSGALIEHPEAHQSVLAVAVVSLVLTVFIGIYFLYTAGWQLFPIGLSGVVLIVLYTSWINKKPLLCLMAPGFAFGPLMMSGTEIVLTGQVSQTGWVAAAIPFLMVNNLLLINQLPDQQADTQVGRLTFPIRFGMSWSLRVYLLFSLLAGACIVAFSQLTDNKAALLALFPWLLTIMSWVMLKKHQQQTINLSAMALNVVTTLTTPLTLAVVVVIKG